MNPKSRVTWFPFGAVHTKQNMRQILRSLLVCILLSHVLAANNMVESDDSHQLEWVSAIVQSRSLPRNDQLTNGLLARANVMNGLIADLLKTSSSSEESGLSNRHTTESDALNLDDSIQELQEAFQSFKLSYAEATDNLTLDQSYQVVQSMQFTEATDDMAVDQSFEEVQNAQKTQASEQPDSIDFQNLPSHIIPEKPEDMRVVETIHSDKSFNSQSEIECTTETAPTAENMLLENVLVQESVTGNINSEDSGSSTDLVLDSVAQQETVNSASARLTDDMDVVYSKDQAQIIDPTKIPSDVAEDIINETLDSERPSQSIDSPVRTSQNSIDVFQSFLNKSGFTAKESAERKNARQVSDMDTTDDILIERLKKFSFNEIRSPSSNSNPLSPTIEETFLNNQINSALHQTAENEVEQESSDYIATPLDWLTDILNSRRISEAQVPGDSNFAFRMNLMNQIVAKHNEPPIIVPVVDHSDPTLEVSNNLYESSDPVGNQTEVADYNLSSTFSNLSEANSQSRNSKDEVDKVATDVESFIGFPSSKRKDEADQISNNISATQDEPIISNNIDQSTNESLSVAENASEINSFDVPLFSDRHQNESLERDTCIEMDASQLEGEVIHSTSENSIPLVIDDVRRDHIEVQIIHNSEMDPISNLHDVAAPGDWISSILSYRKIAEPILPADSNLEIRSRIFSRLVNDLEKQKVPIRVMAPKKKERLIEDATEHPSKNALIDDILDRNDESQSDIDINSHLDPISNVHDLAAPGDWISSILANRTIAEPILPTDSNLEVRSRIFSRIVNDLEKQKVPLRMAPKKKERLLEDAAEHPSKNALIDDIMDRNDELQSDIDISRSDALNQKENLIEDLPEQSGEIALLENLVLENTKSLYDEDNIEQVGQPENIIKIIALDDKAVEPRHNSDLEAEDNIDREIEREIEANMQLLDTSADKDDISFMTRDEIGSETDAKPVDNVADNDEYETSIIKDRQDIETDARSLEDRADESDIPVIENKQNSYADLQHIDDTADTGDVPVIENEQKTDANLLDESSVPVSENEQEVTNLLQPLDDNADESIDNEQKSDANVIPIDESTDKSDVPVSENQEEATNILQPLDSNVDEDDFPVSENEQEVTNVLQDLDDYADEGDVPVSDNEQEITIVQPLGDNADEGDVPVSDNEQEVSNLHPFEDNSDEGDVLVIENEQNFENMQPLDDNADDDDVSDNEQDITNVQPLGDNTDEDDVPVTEIEQESDAEIDDSADKADVPVTENEQNSDTASEDDAPVIGNEQRNDADAQIVNDSADQGDEASLSDHEISNDGQHLKNAPGNTKPPVTVDHQYSPTRPSPNIPSRTRTSTPGRRGKYFWRNHPRTWRHNQKRNTGRNGSRRTWSRKPSRPHVPFNDRSKFLRRLIRKKVENFCKAQSTLQVNPSFIKASVGILSSDMFKGRRLRLSKNQLDAIIMQEFLANRTCQGATNKIRKNILEKQIDMKCRKLSSLKEDLNVKKHRQLLIAQILLEINSMDIFANLPRPLLQQAIDYFYQKSKICKVLPRRPFVEPIDRRVSYGSAFNIPAPINRDRKASDPENKVKNRESAGGSPKRVSPPPTLVRNESRSVDIPKYSLIFAWFASTMLFFFY